MKSKSDENLKSYSQDVKSSEEPNELKNNAFVEAKIGCEKTLAAESQPADKSLTNVDTNIFKYFKELTNSEENIRTEAALHLLLHLQRTKDSEKRHIDLNYKLKRSIRGCGASTNFSRAGFFTLLVGLLRACGDEELTMEQIFQTLNKELRVGATVSNKEDADAVVGNVLVCGALLRSGRLTKINSEYLEQITNILLQSSRPRTYHASLGFSFIVEMCETLSKKQFESSVWPLLQKELAKPWSKQSIQTIHCLIAVQKKFPKIVNTNFFKTHFGGPELLNPESFQYLHKIFWEHGNTDILTHPAFQCFGSYIASSKYLTQFWCETVEPGLSNPTKLLEIETLKILTDILDNLNVEQTNVYELLTDNFMRMLIEGLKNLKQKKDETIKAFYADFLESLVKCCEKLTDTVRVTVIKRLILPPGIFNIEKFTGNRIVHQLINTLSSEGVIKMFELYKSIFLANLAKNPENSSENWLNFERLNAGYMLQHLLQHKSVHNNYKWREEQLKFLFTCGLFYVNESTEICKKEAAGSFSKDFADQCKNMFFTSLQTKLSDMQQEHQLLLNLAEYCNEKILQKHANKYFRIQKFDDVLQKSWKIMYESVTQSNKSNVQENTNRKRKSIGKNSGGKLQIVFNILLLNMGLQLFREPEMAGPAIDDLLKCMDKTNQQNKNKKRLKTSSKQDEDQKEDPEWIEVVVDFFLHLLSKNNSALRNIVNALFPHLCDNLSLTAIHQILAMLDMKDGQNPLSSKNELEEEEVEEEEEEMEENTEDKANDNDDDDEEEDDDDDEYDTDDDDNEENVTGNDKLRNAISQALITTGSPAGIDDDMESIDLNEITEEEGRKLDEALAEAFKAMKKSGGSSSQTKKSKSFRVQITTVMHFRIRVLDLIEIYLNEKPSLLISIEIMLSLFNMLEYCVGDELKPLQTKVEKVLTKLTSLKNYTTEEDLTEDNFVDFIRLIVEKKAPAPAYDIINKLRNKCTCFLIAHAYKINSEENTHKILQLCQEYTQEFINSRNPVINITLLSDIFKLRWRNVWNLAEDLTKQALNLHVRTFRRIQIIEILSILYRNNELQKQNEDLTKKRLNKIEKALSNHIKSLSENDSIIHSSKEFQALIDLLLIAKKAHQRLQMPSELSSESTLNNVQKLRKYVRLESAQAYHRFCNIFKLDIIRNAEVQIKSDKQEIAESEIENDTQIVENGQVCKTAQKRKLSAKDLRKIKKEKKQQRLEAASRGLNGNIDFTHQNGDGDGTDSA